MEVISNVPELNSEGLNKSEKANNGSYSSQKNRIQVSNSKKPLFFYVNLAKKYLRLHEEVELSALGMAIATVVTISEILKNNGLAIEKKILTSTVGMKDENKGKLVKKSKIAILLGKSENFESLLTVATDVVARITEDNKEKVAERKRVLNPKVTRAFNLALQLGKGHYKDGRILKPHLIVKAVDSDLALIMETSQPFKITRLQSCHWTNFRFLCTSGSLSLMIDSNDQRLIEMNLRNGDVKMLPSLPIVVQSLVGCFSGTLSEIALLGLKDQHLYLFLSSGEEWQVIEVSAMSPKLVRQILEGPVVNKKTLFWISNGNIVERLTENGEYSKREIKEFAFGIATCIGVYNSFVYAVQIRGEHTVIAKVATKPDLEYMIVTSVSQNFFCVPVRQCICTGSSDVAGKVYFPDIDYHITGYEPHTQFISSWYPCPGCLHTTSTWVLL